MANCPKCPDTPLRHTLIAGSLPSHGCANCSGVLVSLVSYRYWREQSNRTEPAKPAAGSVEEVADTRDALACSKCSRIMTKFRVSADTDNRIDFCVVCDDVWLDNGEWELIEATAGTGQLSNITTTQWQYRINTDMVERMHRERRQAEFGDAFDSVEAFATMLEKHPARLEILAYLSGRAR